MVSSSFCISGIFLLNYVLANVYIDFIILGIRLDGAEIFATWAKPAYALEKVGKVNKILEVIRSFLLSFLLSTYWLTDSYKSLALLIKEVDAYFVCFYFLYAKNFISFICQNLK